MKIQLLIRSSLAIAIAGVAGILSGMAADEGLPINPELVEQNQSAPSAPEVSPLSEQWDVRVEELSPTWVNIHDLKTGSEKRVSLHAPLKSYYVTGDENHIFVFLIELGRIQTHRLSVEDRSWSQLYFPDHAPQAVTDRLLAENKDVTRYSLTEINSGWARITSSSGASWPQELKSDDIKYLRNHFRRHGFTNQSWLSPAKPEIAAEHILSIARHTHRHGFDSKLAAQWRAEDKIARFKTWLKNATQDEHFAENNPLSVTLGLGAADLVTRQWLMQEMVKAARESTVLQTATRETLTKHINSLGSDVNEHEREALLGHDASAYTLGHELIIIDGKAGRAMNFPMQI